MKNSLMVVLGAVAVLLLACVIFVGLKYREQGARFAETRKSEEDVRSQFNAALESIAEVQDSLNAITPEETHLRGLSQSAETGAGVTQTQKDQMLASIAALKQSVKNSEQRIRQLERNLKGSQAEVAGLRRVIANLKASVAEKNAMIDKLTGQVEELTVNVAELHTDVLQGQVKMASQRATIEEKRREIGTIFYIVGTKKDLEAKGIVTETGGVLGLGKSTQLSGAMKEGDFTSIDTDHVTEIPIAGAEPQVLSAQAKSSYEIVPGDGQSKLRITNVDEFRRVRYLVIMVKG